MDYYGIQAEGYNTDKGETHEVQAEVRTTSEESYNGNEDLEMGPKILEESEDVPKYQIVRFRNLYSYL